MRSLFPHLLELLEEGSQGLPGVAPRRMFGCDALFAYGNIYALIWQDGRIGLRLPEPTVYAELLALEGAEPWRVMDGAKPMSHWVLVPESFHDEPEQLGKWVRRAYDFAAKAPPKKPKPAKKAAALAKGAGKAAASSARAAKAAPAAAARAKGKAAPKSVAAPPAKPSRAARKPATSSAEKAKRPTKRPARRRGGR